MQFAVEESEQVASAVSANRLLAPPGGDGSEPFNLAVRDVRENYLGRLTGEYGEWMSSLADGQIAVMYICDQLSPQYHLVENSHEQGASPLLARPQHWSLFRTLRRVEREQMLEHGLLNKESNGLIEALNDSSFAWLGNVPPSDLVRLRQDLANESFRNRLDAMVDELGGVKEHAVDTVIPKVSRGIERQLAEHQSDAREIMNAYQRKHANTAVAGWVTFVASFTSIPVLSAGRNRPLGEVREQDEREDEVSRASANASWCSVYCEGG